MKKTTFYILLFIPLFAFSQALQNNAPWMSDSNLKKKGKLTLKEVSIAAEKYFSTIDINKKGSGYKPFVRWQYNTQFYTNPDGTIKTASDIWNAWQEKNDLNRSAQNNANDTSNWTSLGPYDHTNTSSWSPGQGRVNVIEVDPSNANTYYAGAPAGGIWKSTDAGVNWQPLSDYLPQIGVSGIAIHPTNSNIIYIATGDDDASDSYSVGVMKSTDGGATWNTTGAMTGSPTSMNDIYIDESDPNIITVATSSGVHKSTDGGATWVRKLTANIIDLKQRTDGSPLWYAASASTVYRSLDGAETFTPISIIGLNNSRRIALAVTPANPNLVYLVSYNGSSTNNGFNGVYKSTNSGLSFSRTGESDDIFGGSQSWYDLSITVSDTDENMIFIGVLNIWKSTDGGDDFSKINDWNAPTSNSYTHADIHFLKYIDGKFFAGTDGGAYVSTNNGSNFTDLTENMVISQFYKISVAQQNYNNIVGGLQDNGGFAFTNNRWNVYHGADGMDCVVNPADANNFYGFIQYGGALYETKDGGLSRQVSVGAPTEENNDGLAGEESNENGGRWVTPLAINSKGEVYAGYKQLYKLVNRAWTKVSNHDFGGTLASWPRHDRDLQNIEIDSNNDDNIYVTRGPDLFKSADGGATFVKVAFTGGTINSFEVSNNDSDVAWVAVNNAVYKTTNLRDETPTFTNISGNLPSSDNKLVVRHHPGHKDNRIYVGTTLGVYFIDDTETDWQTFDNNLPNTQIRDLEINEKDGKLIAATYGRGVFVTDIPKSLPTNEVKLVSIDSPVNNSTGCGSVAPTITIKNQGTETITAITVNYNLDGGSNSVYNWAGTLASEGTTQINIPGFNTSVGDHVLNIETVLTNDTFDSNNASTNAFTINAVNDTPTTVNTFESIDDNLIVETTGSSPLDLWLRGTPSKTLLNTVGSGTSAYVTSIAGNHPDKTTGLLYTKCYDLTQVTNPILSFKMAFDIEEDWDHMYVEYTTDQGQNWSILGTASDPNWYNSSSTANGLPGKQWTGEGEDSNPLGDTNATLHDYSYDLAAFTSEPSVIFRFKFVADDATNEEGVLLDDLVITGVLPVNEFSQIKGLAIYPNPSSSVFNINWAQGDNFSISVFDITGKLLLQEKSNASSMRRFELDMSKFGKGIYFAKIKVDDKLSNKKLILK